MIEVKRTVAGVDLHATFLHKLIIAVEQKMHLLSTICQLAAVIAADGTYSYDSVNHYRSKFSAKIIIKNER